MIARVRQAAKVLAPEAGIAMPVALAVLAIALLLTASAVMLASDTSQLSNRDTNLKAAVAAADAGLRAAVYRLNEYQPDANNCPTEPTNYAVGTNGAPTSTLCAPDGPESVGNSATFTYWISRVMQSGDKCAGPTVSSGNSTVVQRCITAVGTANGVSARVQERVVAYTSTPVFPTAIFGTRSVTVSNNATIVSNTPGDHALLGTNGVLTIGGQGGGTTVVDGWQVPPGVTTVIANNYVDTGPTSGIAYPYPTPTPINPGKTYQNTSSPYDTNTTFQDGTCEEPSSWTGDWVQTNCDYRITRGLTYPACLSLGVTVPDCDASVGNVSFNASSRVLTLGNNSQLVLGGGFYNFCSISLANNSLLTIAAGAKVSIFVDSPNDPSSGCTTSSGGTGTFTMSQNSAINPGGSALNAQIYVFGDQANTPPNNTVNLNNNASSSFALVAPFSNVNVIPSNNSTFVGAIIGYSVTLGQASHFTYEADAQSLATTAIPIFYRFFWEQCPAKSTSPTDPTAGC